ncbi:unnamed protein product [Urochloa humidicola]
MNASKEEAASSDVAVQAFADTSAHPPTGEREKDMAATAVIGAGESKRASLSPPNRATHGRPHRARHQDEEHRPQLAAPPQAPTKQSRPRAFEPRSLKPSPAARRSRGPPEPSPAARRPRALAKRQLWGAATRRLITGAPPHPAARSRGCRRRIPS